MCLSVFTRIFILMAFLTLPISSAYAAKVYGVLRVVKGKVQIKDSKNKVKRARIGQKVYPKDTIITEKDSRAKIVMVDKNEINVSPDSEVVIQNYEYDPKKGKKNVLLNVIYGKIRNKVKQKYNGDSAKFQVKTKSAVAGVRGTDFLTSFNPSTNATNVVTFEGQVAFGVPTPNGGIGNEVKVNPGQFTQSVAGKPPAPPKAMPANQLAGLDKASDSERAPAGADPEMPGAEGQPEGDQEKTEDGSGGDSGAATEESSSNSESESADNGNDSTATTDGGDEGTSADVADDGATSTDAGEDSAETGGSREPSSINDVDASEPTMLTDEDFAGSDGGEDITILEPPPTEPLAPVEFVCEFCKETIVDGNTRLLINIKKSN